MYETTTTKIRVIKRVDVDYVPIEEAFYIARDLLSKWRMNDAFRAPSDPSEACIMVTSTQVFKGNGSDLIFEFECLKSKDENLEYMVGRYLESVDSQLQNYSYFKYHLSISKKA